MSCLQMKSYFLIHWLCRRSHVANLSPCTVHEPSLYVSFSQDYCLLMGTKIYQIIANNLTVIAYGNLSFCLYVQGSRMLYKFVQKILEIFSCNFVLGDSPLAYSSLGTAYYHVFCMRQGEYI